MQKWKTLHGADPDVDGSDDPAESAQATRKVRRNQFGTQTAVLISPNSRAILRQLAPASSLTYTSPKRLNATMRLASAGCVARPHTVALGWVGSSTISQVSPKFVVRSTCPFSPVVVSPHPTNSTAGSSVLTTRPRA